MAKSLRNDGEDAGREALPCTADEASAVTQIVQPADPFGLVYEPEPGELRGALRVKPDLRTAVTAALAKLRGA